MVLTINAGLLQLVPTDDGLHQDWKKYCSAVNEETRRSTVMVLNSSDKKDDKEIKLRVPVSDECSACLNTDLLDLNLKIKVHLHCFDYSLTQ